MTKIRQVFSGFSAVFDDKLLRTFAETVVGAASADVLLTKAYFRRGIYTGAGLVIFKQVPALLSADRGVMVIGPHQISYKVLPPRKDPVVSSTTNTPPKAKAVPMPAGPVVTAVDERNKVAVAMDVSEDDVNSVDSASSNADEKKRMTTRSRGKSSTDKT